LEEIIHLVIEEEAYDLKLQLENEKTKLENEKTKLKNMIQNVDKEKEDLKEKTLLEQFPLNTQCIYIGLIGNKTKVTNETIIKFGQSNNLNERVKMHKKTYENFRLYNAFKVKNKIEIENCIKKHYTLKNRLRIVTIDDIAHRELIALDDDEFTLATISIHTNCQMPQLTRITLPKIKKFEYSDIKYNIEELISFLSESYYLESIYNIIDYRPKLIYLQDLEKIKDFQRLEFRFKNKN
jgi:hypothetical protein